MSAVQLVPSPRRELVLECVIPGEPVPKARVRVTGRGTFTPARTLHAEQALEWALAAAGAVVRRVPMVLDVDFFLGNKRRVDLDNLWKLVCDAGNGIVWVDDSQIVGVHAFKFVDRERPRTELRVWTVEEVV